MKDPRIEEWKRLADLAMTDRAHEKEFLALDAQLRSEGVFGGKKLADLMQRIRSSSYCPTLEEGSFIAQHGTFKDVEAAITNAGFHPDHRALRTRYNAERRKQRDVA